VTLFILQARRGDWLARRPLQIVHGPRPEPPAAIDLAIVEAVIRKLLLGPGDDLEPVGVRIHERDTVFGPGNESAAFPWCQRADAQRRWPLGQPAVVVEPEDLPALDVEPVERRLARHPDRPFPEHGVNVRDALHLTHSHCPRQQ